MKVAATILVTVLLLTGCSAGTPELEVTTDPPPAETSTPSSSASPTAEAEQGTRFNPLGIGEYRKLSGESMWTVGASGPTQISDGYVILPLQLNMDWAASQAQLDASGEGGNVADLGIDPWQALTVSFVSSSGRSFTTFDQYEVDVPNDLYHVGTVYPPTDSLQVNVPMSVTPDQVAGGVWKIENSRGAAVFLAAQ